MKFGIVINNIILFEKVTVPEKIIALVSQHVCLGLYLLYIIISFLPKGRSFTANSDTKAKILPKGRFSIANSGT